MKKIIILLLSLMFFTCKDKKVEKANQSDDKKVDQIERKKINIDGLSLYEPFDNKEGKKTEVYGDFKTDRFNADRKCLSIDGLSDFAVVYDLKTLNPINEITISIWYKPDSFRGMGNNAILWKNLEFEKPKNPQYFISTVGDLYPVIPSTLKFGISIGGKLHVLKTKSHVWSPNKWYNIVARYDGKKIELYINSKLFAKRNTTGKIDRLENDGGDVYFGKIPQQEYYTPGSIDDFRLYNRAITDEEIVILSKEK